MLTGENNPNERRNDSNQDEDGRNRQKYRYSHGRQQNDFLRTGSGHQSNQASGQKQANNSTGFSETLGGYFPGNSRAWAQYQGNEHQQKFKGAREGETPNQKSPGQGKPKTSRQRSEHQGGFDQAIEGRDHWIPDSKAKQCSNPQCSKDFGFFQRRHHCRACCFVFCQQCTIKTNISTIKGNPRVLHSKMDSAAKQKASKNDKESVRICQACKADMEVRNNLQWNQYNQQRVFKYRELNQQDMNSEDNLSMFSENQSRRTKEDHDESVEGRGAIGATNDNKERQLTGTTQRRQALEGQPDGGNESQIQEQTGQIQGAMPAEDPEEEDSGEEQRRLADYLDDQQQLIADVDQERQQEPYQRTKSRTIEAGRSEGRFGESFAYTEHNDKNRADNHQRWKKLKELSKQHINQIVTDELLAANLDDATWGPYLHKFVIQAVDSVKPSSRYLKDSMDFNKFVEIQLLDHSDASKSQYVNGCVVMKNLADRRMPRRFENPSILLLKGSLGFMRQSEEGLDPQSNKRQDIYMDINSVINQEDHYVQILQEKIKLISPNVIVTEKDISFKVLEVLRKNDIAAITNLHLDKMKKLARLTKTIIAPSANVIHKNFQMGKCSSFRVIDPPRQSIISGGGGPGFGGRTGYGGGQATKSGGARALTRPNHTTQHADSSLTRFNASKMASLAEIDQNKQVIFFEGCNPVLGCTILLSGPFRESTGPLSSQRGRLGLPSHDDFDKKPRSIATRANLIQDQLSGYFRLLKVQWSLRKMLHMSRNVILERELLYQLRVSPQAAASSPRNHPGENSGRAPKDSPFLVTKTIKNRSTIVLYKVMVKKGLQTLKNEQSLMSRRPTANQTFEQDSIDVSNGLDAGLLLQRGKSNRKKAKNVFAQSNDPDRGRLTSPDALLTEPAEGPANEKHSRIDENFVKTKFDSMCGQPRKIKFQFYNINLVNYDLRYQQQYSAEHLSEGVERQQHGDYKPQYLDFVDKLDCHHFEKDETLGSFLTRIAQQCEKNKDAVQDQLAQYQKYQEDRLACQSHSTYFYGMSTSNYDPEVLNQAFGGRGRNAHLGPGGDHGAERQCHILQCTHKTCKDQLYKHVQSFYHKDGHLDIQVQQYQKHAKAMAGAQAPNDSRAHQEDQPMAFEDQNQSESLQVRPDSGAGPQAANSMQKQAPGVAYGTSAFFIPQKSTSRSRAGADPKSLGSKTGAVREKRVRNWHKVYMSSQCNVCGYSSHQRQLLSDTLFEYSLSRFIEQYFYNDGLARRSQSGCEHCPLRDATRWFHMADGSTITFKFTRQDVYTIDLLNIKQQHNNLGEVTQLCTEKSQRIEYLIAVKQSKFKSLTEVFGRVAGSCTDDAVMDGLDQPNQQSVEPQIGDDTEPAQDANGREADPLMTQLEKMKELMLGQVSKLEQYFEQFCRKTREALGQVLTELGSQAVPKHSQKHYTPQDILKLNFIERKFVMNYLSVESVARQYLKSLCIVLALSEQRQQAIELGSDPALGDDGLERELPRQHKSSDLAPPALKKSTTGPRLEHAALSLDQAQRASGLFPLLNPRLSKHLSQRAGGLSTTSLKKTLSSAPNADQPTFDGAIDDYFGLEQDLLAGNQAGAPPNSAQASFFLLKGSPLIVSQAQMLEFLLTFYGHGKGEGPAQAAAAKLTEQEVKSLYNHGYRLICEKIKHQVRLLFREVEQHGAPNLRPEASSPALGKTGSFRTVQAEPAQVAEEDQRRCGINSLFLPLGSDNGLVEVNPEDNGSIIAYALNSNLYKEALIKNNYLDFQSRAKQLIQQQNDLKKAPTSAAGHQSAGQRTQRQVMSLVHKDDIFNYEFAPQFIETELLCGEQQRLSFALSFSSYKEDSSIQIQRHSNSNYTEIKQDENSMMFNSFKKVKFSSGRAEQAQTQQKSHRGEANQVAGSSKLFAKHKDLNLQTQVLKDYPIHLLEVQNNTAASQRTQQRDTGGPREAEQGGIAYESIQLLQTKVYNELYQMFFENNTDSALQQQYIQSQIQGQYQEHTGQNQQTQSQNNQKSRPQIVVGGGFGVAVATNAAHSTAPNQHQNQASSGHPQAPSTANARQKGTKQNLLESAHIQTSLFGIRRPLSIFYDNDYKQRIMAEEMAAAQSIIYPCAKGSPELPSESHLLSAARKEPGKSLADHKDPAGTESGRRKDNKGESFHSRDQSEPQMRPFAKAQPWEQSPQTITSPRSPLMPPQAPTSITKVDYNVKLYYPKKFEVLRKFYCGSHLNFIQSMMSSDSWKDVTGGKTQSPFQKTFDKKYVMKEVKRPELKMFLEFAPQYFDYLCKSFFHDYPCTLAKIVGVYKIKITKYVEKVSTPALAAKGPPYSGADGLPAGLPHPGGGEATNQPGPDFGALKDIFYDQGAAAGIIDPDDQAEYLQSCNSQVLEKNQKVHIKTIKKYVFVSENLNYGLAEEDERHIVRYDLKGSTLNRFVMDPKEKEAKGNQHNQGGVPDTQHLQLSPKASASHHNLKQADLAILGYNGTRTGSVSTLAGGSNQHLNLAEQWKTTQNTSKDNRGSGRVPQSRVYHDNNFIYEMGARPLPMRYNMNKILNVCVNNDTLCLAKSQIIDYSLLVIINTQTKKLRFGIIDYVQHYTLEKMFETRFKKFWKGNEPTIIEPEKYKKRFKKAIKRYFVAMCIQNEKIDKYERPQQLQIGADPRLSLNDEGKTQSQTIAKPYTDFQKGEDPEIDKENN